MDQNSTGRHVANVSAPVTSGRPTVWRAPLLSMAVAAAAGMWSGQMAVISWATCYALAVGGLAAWGWCWRCGRMRLATVLLLAAVGCGAGAWHQLRWRYFDIDDMGHLARYVAAPICFEAIALAAPERLAAPPADPLRAVPAWERSRMVLRAIRVRDGRQWRRVSGRVLLDVDGHVLGVGAGDRLRVFGQLVRPRPAMNPGGFDAALHARRRRQLCRVFSSYPDAVQVVHAYHGWWSFRRWLDRLRMTGERTLRRVLEPAQQRLAAALLLGRRRDVQPQRIEAFARSGTLHLLAISGMHVGMFAMLWMVLLRLGWLSEKVALVAAASSSVVYAALVGGQPSVVRATVMIVGFCLARLLGRVAWSANTLGGAAVVLLAADPATLLSTGAQLSLVAVAALIAVSKIWTESDFLQQPTDDDAGMANGTWRARLRRVGIRAARGGMGLLVASLAIWCVTAPLVMQRFHSLSPLAPLLTVVLFVPVSAALLSGFATMTLGWLVPGVADWLAWPADIALRAIGIFTERAAGWPWNPVWVAGVPTWWLVGFYGALGSAWWHGGIRRRWLAAGLFAWVGVGLLAASIGPQQREPSSLQCTFLSVGHGLAVVVELPDGRTLLYDAGRFGAPEWCAREIAAFLWQRGIRHLDAVVLSHADVDHYNALPGLIERFSIGVVYTSPMMFEGRSAAVERLRAALEQAKVRQAVLSAPQRLETGTGVTIEALHPTRQGVLGSDNANSLVLLITYRGRRILLTGDVEGLGLRALLSEEPIRCDVLLAPHHGSRRSDFRSLAKWARPRVVVVSGPRWRDAAPLADGYRAAGAEVFHTDRDGAVRVVVERRGIRAVAYREPDGRE